jgi:hypothetical protein
VLTLVRPGGDLVGPAPADTRESQVAHQPLDRATGDPGAFPVELGPDLVGAVDVEVVAVNPEDLDLQVLRSSSRSARAEGGRFFATQYVFGAIWQPCSVSTRQIGSTPKRSR